MSYTDEQKAIMGRLETGWGTTTPIAWPNAIYPPPADHAASPDKYDDAAYIEPRVARQPAFNTDLGTDRRVRHPGLLTINVRTRLGEGDKEAMELADKAAALFRNVTFSGITFRAPTVRDFGRDDGMYLVQVDCPFWRDSIHTID